MTPDPNPQHRAAVRIADDHITLPPSASVMITIYCEDAAFDVDAIIDSNQRLLLSRDVSVASGVARVMK